MSAPISRTYLHLGAMCYFRVVHSLASPPPWLQSCLKGAPHGKPHFPAIPWSLPAQPPSLGKCIVVREPD